MIDKSKGLIALNRRQFAGLLGTGFAAIGFGQRGAAAQEDEEPKGWKAHRDAILRNKTPVEDKVTLDLPEIAENGNLVPFSVAVDYPMTDTDFIQAVHVIATANESPPVASFYFTPLSSTARASSRMRLLQTQDIVALAQTSGGEFFIGRRRVEVIVGCCGE